MNEQEKYMQEYLVWKKNNFNNKQGFFPVFSTFLNKMPELSTGAISLYLYFGLYSNNSTGESFHSLEKIAAFFNKTPRTITSWIKELECNQLIARKQIGYNKVAITYLLPYK